MENTQLLTPEKVNNSVALNLELRKAGLWKKGCQFLSTQQKQDLLSGDTNKVLVVEAILEDKMAQIALKSATQQRSLIQVNPDGSLSYKEDSSVHQVNHLNQLNKFFFKVSEQPIYIGADKAATSDYKAVVKEDGKLISVMKNSYKLLSNREVISGVMEQLENLDSPFIVGTESFVCDEKMRINFEFPEIKFIDEMGGKKNESNLRLSVHNSYDGSESVKFNWGALRLICSNGMTAFKTIANFNRRHTSGLSVHGLIEEINQVSDKIPMLEKKIAEMNEKKASKKELEKIRAAMPAGANQYLDWVSENQKENIQTLWGVYNVLTYYASHAVSLKHRAVLQEKISQQFSL